MPGKYYKFDHESLHFNSEKPDIRQRFRSFIRFFSLSLLFASLLTALFFLISGSPKQKILERKNARLVSKYECLKEVFDTLNASLNTLSYTDDSIYRIIVGSDPLSPEIRKGGFGGTDKYKQLENLENANLVISKAKELDILSKKAQVQLNSFNEVLEKANENEKLHGAMPAISPIPEDQIAYISDYFGPRKHPIYHEELFHWGVDLAADKGTKIYAPGDGIVEELNYASSGYGRTLVIDHGYGFKTLYGHLSNYNVKQGDKVKRGDLIAFVGNAGTSSGPHLHYEIIKDDKKINPFNYFSVEMDPKEYHNIISR